MDLLKTFEEDEDTNPLIEKDAKNGKVISVKINGGVLEMQNDKVILLAE